MAIRDTFSEVSNTEISLHTPDTSDTASGWVADAGTWQVNSGDYLEATAMAGGIGSFASIDVGNSDFIAECEVKINSNTSEGFSFVFRRGRTRGTRGTYKE